MVCRVGDCGGKLEARTTLVTRASQSLRAQDSSNDEESFVDSGLREWPDAAGTKVTQRDTRVLLTSTSAYSRTRSA